MDTFDYIPQPNQSATAAELKELTAELERIDSWVCAHSTTELRVHIASNDSRHYCTQCMTCGEKVGVVKKSSVGTEPPLIDKELAEAFRDRRNKRREHLRARRMEIMRALHNEYLFSDKWRELRRKALSRDGGTCQGCMDAKAEHVHHLTYKRWGDELLIDLVSLCEPCHVRCHADADLESFLSWLCQEMDLRRLNIGEAYT